MARAPARAAGGGARKTPRLVARYGDACNLFASFGAEGLGRKLAVLREHCQAVGRPYEEIEKTSYSVLPVTRHGRDGTLSPAAAIDQLAGWRPWGSIRRSSASRT